MVLHGWRRAQTVVHSTIPRALGSGLSRNGELPSSMALPGVSASGPALTSCSGGPRTEGVS